MKKNILYELPFFSLWGPFLGLSSATESSAGSHVVVTNKVTVHQYIVQIIVQKVTPPCSTPWSKQKKSDKWLSQERRASCRIVMCYMIVK